MKNIFASTAGKAALGIIVSVASVITAIDGVVKDNKQKKEFEDMKKAIADLQNKN